MTTMTWIMVAVSVLLIASSIISIINIRRTQRLAIKGLKWEEPGKPSVPVYDFRSDSARSQRTNVSRPNSAAAPRSDEADTRRRSDNARIQSVAVHEAVQEQAARAYEQSVPSDYFGPSPAENCGNERDYRSASTPTSFDECRVESAPSYSPSSYDSGSSSGSYSSGSSSSSYDSGSSSSSYDSGSSSSSYSD